MSKKNINLLDKPANFWVKVTIIGYLILFSSLGTYPVVNQIAFESPGKWFGCEKHSKKRPDRTGCCWCNIYIGRIGHVAQKRKTIRIITILPTIFVGIFL